MTLEFRILGPLEVRRDGVPVRLGGPRQRALLALLLTRANAIVPRNRLIDELWPEDPPATAVNVLQTYVSHLRKALQADRLLTRTPGYVLRVEPGELDLHGFQQLAEQGRTALAAGDPEQGAAGLRRALELWRGPALADVVDAAFAEVEAARLEELRLATHEELLDAELARGRHAEVVGELEALVAEHPLRERVRSQLMLALYRSGRQSEALAAYRDGRARLIEELGIEPGPRLRELEAAILRQDAVLDPFARTSATATGRSLLVVSLAGDLATAVELSVPLARQPAHEVVLVRLVTDPAGLAEAVRIANEARATLAGRHLIARSTAFTSIDVAADTVRLAADSNVALLLLDGTDVAADERLGRMLTTVLAEAACDVAVLVGRRGRRPASEVPDRAAVVVPFGGAEHEWAAAEIGAWIAASEGRPLVLAGTGADQATGRRDASRLLASVALLVQQVAGVETQPVLVRSGVDGMVAIAAGARVVLLGLPDDWRAHGLGTARTELARQAVAPLLLVRGGLRPGGLAPADGLTRFTWTFGEQRGPPALE